MRWWSAPGVDESDFKGGLVLEFSAEHAIERSGRRCVEIQYFQCGLRPGVLQLSLKSSRSKKGRKGANSAATAAKTVSRDPKCQAGGRSRIGRTSIALLRALPSTLDQVSGRLFNKRVSPRAQSWREFGSLIVSAYWEKEIIMPDVTGH